MSRPTVLVLAAGPGIGAHCIKAFHSANYNVVTASRSRKDNLLAANHLDLHLDLSKPKTIPQIFDKSRMYFKHPEVVIYNGASMTHGPPTDPLSTVELETVLRDANVNVTSALIAAQEAVRGWDNGLSGGCFIYTGTKQNVMADPKALTFGMAKTAAAKMVWDGREAYKSKGYRFYFTDQRKEDGSPAREAMDPRARAEVYVELAGGVKQRPWLYTFVKGRGYVNFAGVDRAWDVGGD